MRFPPRSILWRIAWLQILALGAAYAVMLIAVQVILSQTTMFFQRKTLSEHEAPIAQGLHYTGGRWSLDIPAELLSIYANHYGGYAFSVVNDRGKVLIRSGPARLKFASARLDPRQATYFRQRIGDSAYYGASFPEHRAGATAWIQIAQDIDNPDVVFDDVVHAFLPRMLWLFVPLLALLIAVDVLIVRRCLRPLVKASEMARAIGPATIEVRLPDRTMPREIEPLVGAINQALDRLESGFRAQREFTADAAHEIRTPLAVLKLRVEGLRDAEVSRALAPYIDAMGRIVEQLLAMADLECAAIEPDDRADLCEVCRRVADLLAPAAAAEDKAIAVLAPDRAVLARGREDLLFQAVRNLTQNGLAHTPPGTAVRIEVRAPASIRVMDAGPGVPENQRQLIFRRFWRQDRRRSNGAGLGLAIVARIVEAHGGEISVCPGPDGGALFQLDLTPAEQAS